MDPMTQIGDDDPRPAGSAKERDGRDLAEALLPRTEHAPRTSPMTPLRAVDPPRHHGGDSLAFGRAALECFGHLTGLDASVDTASAVGPSGERVVVVNLASNAAPAVGREPRRPLDNHAGFALSVLDPAGFPRTNRRFPGAAHVERVAVDLEGNLLLTGVLLGTAHLGGPKLTSVGADVFVAKLDPLGNHRWSVRFGDSYGQGKGVAVDRRGNVFVTGVFFGTLDLGTGPIEAHGALSMFVARFDADGRAIWARRFGGASLTMGLGITVRAPDRLSITCLCDGTVDFGGGPLLVPQGTAVVTVELDAMGNHVMSRRAGLLHTRAQE